MWWYVLELTPEADEATVRKAYAKMIKEVDQDVEIERFTKIHQAYRMAMKAFKANKEHPSLKMYTGDKRWYLESLQEIYDRPEKRLNPKAWQYVFDCMSFREEEQFALEYLDFFNDHYYLTDEVWDVIEGHYSIMKNKSFKWLDLVSGSFSVSAMEIDEDNPLNLVTYVEGKIRIFNNILRSDYKEASMLLERMVLKYDQVDLHRWHLMVLCRLGIENELVDEVFVRLIQMPDEADLARFHYAGYLVIQSKYEKALSILQEIDINHRWPALTLLMDRINQKHMDDGKGDFAISKKQERLLSKGNYKKALMIN